MKHSPFTHKLLGVYETICLRFDTTGSILEIGCGPSENTLLNMTALKNARHRVGINLQSYSHYKDFEVTECNANNMRNCFDNDTFDMVLCNVVFEHDRYFWKSLEEIRRVIKPGGVFILGVPGIVSNLNKCIYVTEKDREKVQNLDIVNATITYRVHNAPGDYWRFTEQAYKEVLMEGFVDVDYSVFLTPPIIVGCGVWG